MMLTKPKSTNLGKREKSFKILPPKINVEIWKVLDERVPLMIRKQSVKANLKMELKQVHNHQIRDIPELMTPKFSQLNLPNLIFKSKDN